MDWVMGSMDIQVLVAIKLHLLAAGRVDFLSPYMWLQVLV
jgi:hypothetical protein